jgi:hypothetical protein
MAFLLTFSGGASATYKDAVRVARDTQLALTGSHPLTVDGVVLADKDRVLLKGQTAGEENGIYVYNVASGNYSLTRAVDANNSNEVLPNMLVPVSEGTANADKIFQLVTNAPIVLDTTPLVFSDVLIGLANKADRDLANLLPTSINQSLLFADDTSYNIGASGASRPQTLYVKSAINLDSLTASEILASDASKNVVSLGVATYPSLTELSYVKGVTSALQTQLGAKVDSVSGTAPISSSGGVTPTISISQSGAAQDGYLSSTDWNTFNNKQPAGNYITALTGDVTASGPGSAAATIANSAVTNAKLADMADVTIKGNNSGVSAAPSDLSASTVTSMLNAFTGATSLANGVKGLVPQPLIADELKFLRGDGGWVTIPDPLPAYSDDRVLYSTGSAAEWRTVGTGSTTAAYPTDTVIVGRLKPASVTGANQIIIGPGAGNALTTGSDCVFIGKNAGLLAQNSVGSVAIGLGALDNLTTENGTGALDKGTVAIGQNAFGLLTASSDGGGGGGAGVAIGKNAGANCTTGSANVFIGTNAAAGWTTAQQAVCVGLGAGNSANSQGSNFIGYNAGRGVTGQGNIIIARNWQNQTVLTTGNNNTFVGDVFGYVNATYGVVNLTSGSDNIGLGAEAGFLTATTSSAITIGKRSAAGSNEFAVGSSTNQINTMLLGRGGHGQTVANAVKIMTMRASGTDTSMSVGTLTLAGAQGTGTGAGGDVIIATAPAGSSGSSLNAHVERLRVTAAGNVGIGTATPAEKLDVNGGLKFAGGFTVKSLHAQAGTADVITVAVSDYYVGVDCSGAAKTVNLPAAATAGAGKTFVIKDETGNAATNNITIDADGAELIDGVATYVMLIDREAVTLVCDGTNWQII